MANPGGVPAEAELVEKAVRGDAEAFGKLYDLHVDGVFRYIVYRVGSVPDAEDLTAQTFLQAWQAVHRYRPMGYSFRAWLLTIAHNLAMSYFRSHKPLDCIDDQHELRAGGRCPEDVVVHLQEREGMRRAIACLKGDQQQVLNLRFFEELPYSEIAALMKKSEGAVRVIQHRALLRLRQLMEK